MRTIVHAVARLLGTVLLLCLAACQVTRIEDQETFFEHDAAADRVDMLLVYRGISVWSEAKEGEDFVQGDDPRLDPRKIEQALELAAEILGGQRRFRLLPGSFEFDLDEMSSEARSEADREILDDIELVEVQAFLDEEGRLACFQHLRIEGASRLLARLNALLDESLADEFDAEKVAESDYPESAALWAAAATSGWEWLRFEGPVLVVSIPATFQDAARVLLANCREPENPELFEAVRDIRVEPGRVELLLGSLEDPVIHVVHENEDPRYEAALRARLEEQLGEELPRVEAMALDEAFRGRGSRARTLLEGISPEEEFGDGEN